MEGTAGLRAGRATAGSPGAPAHPSPLRPGGSPGGGLGWRESWGEPLASGSPASGWGREAWGPEAIAGQTPERGCWWGGLQRRLRWGSPGFSFPSAAAAVAVAVQRGGSPRCAGARRGRTGGAPTGRATLRGAAAAAARSSPSADGALQHQQQHQQRAGGDTRGGRGCAGACQRAHSRVCWRRGRLRAGRGVAEAGGVPPAPLGAPMAPPFLGDLGPGMRMYDLWGGLASDAVPPLNPL